MARSIWKKAIVTGLGTGYLPIAPGTWGSGAVCAIFLLVAWASGGRAVCTTAAMIVVVVLSSIGCIALGRFAESTFGRKDPSQCSLDEWAGQALALVALPLHGVGRGLASLDPAYGWLIVTGAAFVTFRVFDIVKPPPADRIQALPAGWGILADDLVAGLYANILCQVVLGWVIPAML